MIRRSWKSLVAGFAIVSGLTAGTAVEAGDAYSAGGAKARTEQIFAESSHDMTAQLTSLSATADATGCDLGYGQGCGQGCGIDDIGCGDGCGEGLFGTTGDSAIKIGGWVQVGYHNRVTPAGVTPNDGLSFNSHPDRLNLHQSWLYAEKVADGSKGFDWGFRADVLYGVDGPDTQSFGSPGQFDNSSSFTRGGGYGWAIPQLYAEVAIGDLSIKAGHFFTLVGYEVVGAPDNFFYSHALTQFNSEPFTHTGVLGTYSASDDTTLYGGWTAGWDTGFDNVNGGSTFLGGFSTAVGDDATFTYITTIGNFGNRGNGADGYAHSLVLDVNLADDLNLVLQSDVVRVGDDDDLGVNTYLIKTINDQLGVGVRAEWWKNEGISQYNVTGGVNIKPTDNLTFRPELRYDWLDPNVGDQFTFGMDAIFTF